ncbi:hypothetical protein chiPu_0031501, partial [Chiloscyllium punctatum]|nr:hypothetical protein [Chiloscyllium punctatum]
MSCQPSEKQRLLTLEEAMSKAQQSQEVSEVDREPQESSRVEEEST